MLLTVDIWDTLLRRRCHPDEIKLFIARRLWLTHRPRLRPAHDTPWRLLALRRAVEHAIGQRTRAAGFDDEYRIADVLGEWLSEALDPPPAPPERDALVAELVELEIDAESAVVLGDDQIRDVLRTYGVADPVLVSDFYLPGAAVARIVKHAMPDLTPRAIVVSCDVSLNKRSGRLFTHVYEQFSASSAEHVHIGDSRHADVDPPRRLGATAVHYQNRGAEQARSARNAAFATRETSIAPVFRELEAQLAQTGETPTEPIAAELFRLGRRYAPLFCGFVLFCIEQALQRRAARVHYFAREGVFFQKIHERLRAVAPLGVDIPPGTILDVSRLATFFPSLRELTPRELMRIWSLYSTQSMAALAATFGLDEAWIAPHCARHGIAPRDPIQYPWQDPRVMQMLADPAFQADCLALRNDRRRRLLAYLAAKGITPGGPPQMIVDIGWRGTIQDNLACLLPDVQFQGVYFALKHFLNEQPPNAAKIAFGPDENRDKPIETMSVEYVPPIEMLTNCPGGSVRDYVDSPAGVVATRDVDPEEDVVHERYTRHFQAGVLSSVDAFAAWVRLHAVTAGELRPHALALLRELTCEPPAAVVRAYFDLNHNERFGLGRYVKAHTAFPWSLALAGLFRRSQLRKFVDTLKGTGWPQGFLELNGQRLMRRVYNLAIEARRRR